MNIGDKISRERKVKGLSQKELASLLNVSDKLISKWESGRALPSVEYIEVLCNVFDKDFNYFLQKDNRLFKHFDVHRIRPAWYGLRLPCNLCL